MAEQNQNGQADFQKQLDDFKRQNQALQDQLRGLSAERDQYRQNYADLQAQQQQSQQRYAPSQTDHVLARTLGMEGDFSQVDQYYVTRDQHQRDLQEAVNRGYMMARGDMTVLRSIDRATGSYKELNDFESPLAKKTYEILVKEGYAAPMRGVTQPTSWEQFTYNDANALSKAARVAQAELILEQKQNQEADQAAHQAASAAGISSGGAPAPMGTEANEQRFMEAAEKGDISAMRSLNESHVEKLIGRPLMKE